MVVRLLGEDISFGFFSRIIRGYIHEHGWVKELRPFIFSSLFSTLNFIA